MNNWIESEKSIVCPFCNGRVEYKDDDSSKFKYCPYCGNRVVTFKPTYESDKKFVNDCADMLEWAYSSSYEVPINLPDTLQYALDRIYELLPTWTMKASY